MNLYEIDSAILSLIDEETGEIMDYEAYKNLHIDRDKKIENTALFIKNLKAEESAINAEVDNLQERASKIKRKHENLSKYLQTFLAGEKFKTSKVTISYRKSDPVDIVDIEAIPDMYMRTKTTRESDKVAIKQAIKAGNKIPGAMLLDKQNMSIK